MIKTLLKKALPVLTALMLILACAAASAGNIRPAEIAPDSYDLRNGEFCAGLEQAGEPGEGFTLTLCVEDLYDAEEIRNLRPGDTVEVCGHSFTVDLIVIHGEYDSDGDGEPDTGATAVADPEQAKDALERHELVADEVEGLVPYAYEVIPREDDFGGYVSFRIREGDRWPAMINDCVPWTQVGSMEVALPLPEGFAYHEYSGGEETDSTAEDFLGELSEDFNPYNTTVRIADGKLMEVRHSDYPSDPELE